MHHDSVVERVLENVVIDDNGCWLWQGHTVSGYGRLRVGGKKRALAHNVTWQVRFGPTPPGKELDHLCRVRRCCNPEHLEPVTHQVNVQRGTQGAAVVARQRAKTHCPAGHPYNDKNTYIRPNGARNCRKCNAQPSLRQGATPRREPKEAVYTRAS